MLYGIFLTAILQGIFGIGLLSNTKSYFLRDSNDLFGLLPIIGTGIIWLPAYRGARQRTLCRRNQDFDLGRTYSGFR